MKHWRTNLEMGSGYEFTAKGHEYEDYNVLLYRKTKEYEKNIIRTCYLIRDCWTTEQLKELKQFLDDELKDRDKYGE